MRIRQVELWQVVVPMKPGSVNSPGVADPVLTSFHEIPKVILRITTDQGVQGIGESGRGASREAIELQAVQLIGQDILQMNLKALPASAGYDACEIAIYDLVGKALGVPVCSLLGGRFRERVEVDYWMGRGTPEDTARKAEEAATKGFKGIKLKCKLEDPVVERVQAIARVAPQMHIVLDPNERFYRACDALRLAKRLEDYSIACFESPVPQWNLDWYVELRAKTTIPMALHTADPRFILRAMQMRALDILNTGGSMVNFVETAYLAGLEGIPVWHGSGVDLGILDMSYVQACAAAPNATFASDIIGNFLREDDLLQKPIEFTEGCAVVPDRPGLGVTLDERAVTKYSVCEPVQLGG